MLETTKTVTIHLTDEDITRMHELAAFWLSNAPGEDNDIINFVYDMYTLTQ